MKKGYVIVKQEYDGPNNYKFYYFTSYSVFTADITDAWKADSLEEAEKTIELALKNGIYIILPIYY